MQFKLSLLAFWATIISGVLANFNVYRVEFRNARGTDFGWQIFEQHSNCDEALDAWSFPQSDDVSGNKIGVRCKGSGCGERPPPGDIEQLEMHFSNNPLWHFTIYSNRNYEMIGLDGKSYGRCIVFPDADFFCNGLQVRVQANRKFRCLTSLTAAQISHARDISA